MVPFIKIKDQSEIPNKEEISSSQKRKNKEDLPALFSFELLTLRGHKALVSFYRLF
jgi:hypothetical protein